MTTTPTTATSIIDCGGLVFITRPFPSEVVTALLPSEKVQMTIGVNVDTWYAYGDTFFVVMVSSRARPGQARSTPTEWGEKIRRVLRHIWDEMVRRGLESGKMPEISEGNPLDMLPKPD